MVYEHEPVTRPRWSRTAKAIAMTLASLVVIAVTIALLGTAATQPADASTSGGAAVSLFRKPVLPVQVPPPQVLPPKVPSASAEVTPTGDDKDDEDGGGAVMATGFALPSCVELINVTDEHTYWRQDLAANRTTWLHLWAMLGQSEKLVPLVADGANVNARDAAGRTAAMVAAASGQHALPSLVTLCGAASWNPSATCARGFTLWQYLQQCGQLRAARALRSHFHV